MGAYLSTPKKTTSNTNQILNNKFNYSPTKAVYSPASIKHNKL